MRYFARPLLLVSTVLAAPALAADLTPLTYNLNWLPQAEHCGFFQAKATGLYEEAGLDVTLVSGGPETNVPILVAGGAVDLGMGSSFTTMNMAAEGIDGVTIAAFLQKSPQSLVAHPGQGVETLADLKDSEIMVANFSRTEFWQFLKAEHGFRDEQLRPYAYSSAPFLADKRAVQQGYVTEDVFLLGAEMDEPPVSILLADYGYQDYASTVFGMSKWLNENREAVEAFLAASAEGWRACIDGDYEPAKQAVMAANPDHSAALFDFKMSQMIALDMVTGESDLPIGSMDAARWNSFAETMKTAGVYAETLDPTKAYDLTFLPSK